MSHFVIKIGGVDVSSYIMRPTVSVTRELAGRISTASFSFRASLSDDAFRLDLSSLDTTPLDLDRPEPNGNTIVTIEDGNDYVLFRGRIKTLRRTPQGPEMWEYAIACQGIEADLDRIEVDTLFVEKTDRQMIQAALAGNTFGITADSSTIQSTLAAVDFDASATTAKRLIDELVSLTGCDYYVDHDTLALHWYIPNTAELPVAPFGISDNPDNEDTFAAQITWNDEDWIAYANRVTVKGAVGEDGTRYTKTLTSPGTEPEDVYPVTITDDSLTAQQLVDARAEYELAVRSQLNQAGSFEIDRDGLLPGQVLHVTIASRGIDADYQITRIQIREDLAMQQLTYSAEFGLFLSSFYDSARVVNRITKPTGRVQQINALQMYGVIDASGNVTVNTNALYGVILADEVADGVIDSLNKFSMALRPIPILASDPALPNDAYPEGAVYLRSSDSQYRKVVSGAWADVTDDEALAGKMEFVNVGTLNMTQLNGLLLASQIDSVYAEQVNGQLISDQIYSLAVGKLYGDINSGGDVTINASVVTEGTFPGTVQISGSSITGGTISGTVVIEASTVEGEFTGAVSLSGAKINNFTITATKYANGSVTDVAIGNVNVGKLTAGNVEFGGATTIGYNSDYKLSLQSNSIRIQASATKYFQATSAAVAIVNGDRVITLSDGAITFLFNSETHATFNGSGLNFTRGASTLDMTASGIIIAGASGGPNINLSSSNLAIFSGNGHWIGVASGGLTIHASNGDEVRLTTAGLQMTSGQIGLGSGSFATSPLKISTSAVEFYWSNDNRFRLPSVGDTEWRASSFTGILMSGSSGLIRMDAAIAINAYAPFVIQGGHFINCPEYRVGGTKVLGAQGASIADPTDAATTQSALIALLSRCRAHGIIAT